MAHYTMGYGHYMLVVDRRPDGMRDYDLWELRFWPRELMPPPTPLWHWAVW